jgi:hypothetical protein
LRQHPILFNQYRGDFYIATFIQSAIHQYLSLDPGFNNSDLYLNFAGSFKPVSANPSPANVNKDDLLKTVIAKPKLDSSKAAEGGEKVFPKDVLFRFISHHLHCDLFLLLSSKKLETAGYKWFNMPATEVTPEIKHDLLVIKNRDILDPKRHYKKGQLYKKGLPKFFQVTLR